MLSAGCCEVKEGFRRQKSTSYCNVQSSTHTCQPRGEKAPIRAVHITTLMQWRALPCSTRRGQAGSVDRRVTLATAAAAAAPPAAATTCSCTPRLADCPPQPPALWAGAGAVQAPSQCRAACRFQACPASAWAAACHPACSAAVAAADVPGPPWLPRRAAPPQHAPAARQRRRGATANCGDEPRR